MARQYWTNSCYRLLDWLCGSARTANRRSLELSGTQVKQSEKPDLGNTLGEVIAEKVNTDRASLKVFVPRK